MSRLALEDVRGPPRFSMDDFWVLFEEKYSHMADLRELFKDFESMEMRNRELGRATDAMYNFVFQGNPGTGKSTIARELIGPFFCALDIIPSDDVITKRGSAFQGKFVGQTDGVVEAMFNEAWGRTLFIDEVGALTSPGALYSKEAIKAMLPFLEDPELRGRFITIIADYEHNIEAFFGLDDGLERRFPYTITIPDWSDEMCVDKLIEAVRKKDSAIDLASHRDLLLELMPDLTSEEKFANGGTICDSLVGLIR